MSDAELLGDETLHASGQDRDEGDRGESDGVLLDSLNNGIQSTVAGDIA
jgi:hypothetical protein